MSDSAATETAYCADLVRAGDFDRYAASLFVPPERRAALLALYAFNAEIASVREHVTQALAGEIRLQWWTDVLTGKSAADATGHPVAARLLGAAMDHGLPLASLNELIAAHRFDLYEEPMQTAAEMEGYLDQTAGLLFLLGARIIGAAPASGQSPPLEALAHRASLAHGLASLIEALPRHAARRQLYIPVELLDRFSVTRESIFAGTASHNLSRLAHAIADDATRQWNEAMTLLPDLDRAMRPAFLLLALVPGRLRRLSRCGYDPFRLRQPSRLSRLWTLWRSARRFRRL
jgi:15-cis-phytoene synthase